jgi:2-polyprenyl-3-methyl-5-hydroxy-6-metoxy-1,4-benzoquinol methylase
MQEEVKANRDAWGLLSREHYEHYKKLLMDGAHALNPIIRRELGDIAGKRVIHLQCNTGADTIALARAGAIVTGVDLVPANIEYARRLADDLGQRNVSFFESDLMSPHDTLEESDNYDIVFTSEGVICWLPDLAIWGKTIRRLLRPAGFFYVFDSHPFMMAMDERKLGDGVLEIKYPYFKRPADADDEIGGYASPAKNAANYSWMYTMGDIVNALSGAGLDILFLNEHDRLFHDLGGMSLDGANLFYYEHLREKFPMSFSLKAKPRN